MGGGPREAQDRLQISSRRNSFASFLRALCSCLEWKHNVIEKLRSAACSGSRTGAEIARELGRAQIKYAQDIGCFGAEKIRVTAQPACCPQCQATFIILVAGQFHCNQCGNQWGGNAVPPLPSRRDLPGW